MNEKSLKEDIISLLKPLFGTDFIKTVERLYDENEVQEMINVSERLLEGYFGEKEASRLIHNLVKRYKLESKVTISS